MTESQIMAHIVSTMKDAQELYNNGTDKKQFVMNKIKQIIGDSAYIRYEPLISVAVDFIKSIATNKQILRELQQTKCYGTLFNSCNK